MEEALPSPPPLVVTYFFSFELNYLFTTQSRLLTTFEKKKSLLKTLWEKENQHFLLFPQSFLPYQKLLNLSSAYAFNLIKAKVLSFGKELKFLFLG